MRIPLSKLEDWIVMIGTGQRMPEGLTEEEKRTWRALVKDGEWMKKQPNYRGEIIYGS